MRKSKHLCRGADIKKEIPNKKNTEHQPGAREEYFEKKAMIVPHRKIQTNDKCKQEKCIISEPQK